MDLTREQALKLHREMWGDMQKKLGDNPPFIARLRFKLEWCENTGFVNIRASCFLCEFDKHHSTSDRKCNCPIDWRPLTKTSFCDGYVDDKYIGYGNAPISAILALPESEVSE